MEISGKVIALLPLQQVSDKFRKQEVVIQTTEKYPQSICIQFTQDNIAKLDAIAVGSECTIAFNLRGKEWNGKYFNSLEGWKIEVTGQITKQVSSQISSQAKSLVTDSTPDLPF